MVDALALVIFLILILLFIIEQQRPAFSFVLLVGVSVGLVGIFFPVLSQIFGFVTWRDVPSATHLVTNAQWNYIIFEIGILTAAIMTAAIRSVLKGNGQTTIPTDLHRTSAPSWTFLLALILVAVYIWKVKFHVLVNHSDLSKKYLAGSGLGALRVGFDICIISATAAWLSAKTKSARFWPGMALILIIGWAAFGLEVRTYVAIPILSFVFAKSHEKRWSTYKATIRLVTFALLGILLLQYGSVIRGGGSTSGAEPKGSTKVLIKRTIGSSDLSHPFITFLQLERGQDYALIGKGYLDDLEAFIPHFIYPARPPTQAEWFVKKYYPKVSDRGGGAAFSMVGGAWRNFGNFVGPFIMGFLVALSANFLYNMFWLSENVERKAFGAYCAFYIIMIERDGFFIVLKQIFVVGLLYFLFIKSYRFYVFLLRGFRY